MSDNKKQTEEQQMSNDILKDVFQELHDTVVNNINTFSVISKLFSAKVISTDDMHELHFIKNPREKSTRLLIILHKAKNPRTFIELREAIKTEEAYSWLVETIDKKYDLLTSPAAHPQVIQVSSNSSLTSLNGDTGDVTELNHVIDELRKDNSKLTTENSSLLEDNAKQKLDNERLSKDISTLTTENSELWEENKRLKDDNERLCLERSTNDEKMANIVDERVNKELEMVRQSHNSIVTPKVTKLDGATGVSSKELTLDDPQKTSRDTDVLFKRSLRDNPQLLFTLNQPPKYSWFTSDPRYVEGVMMLDKCLYVVYHEYNKVQVFDCEDCGKKIKDIEVKEMKSPHDMVGSSVTSQLFISDNDSDVIWRVDSKTGVSDVFVNTGYTYNTRLSLVENRLLAKSHDSLLMFDIVSGERIKEIPLTDDITSKNVHHAIESNRDTFFVSHAQSDNDTVSEIDSEGRVIRVFDNTKRLYCRHLALDSVGRLLVADWRNQQVFLLNEHVKYERILIDIKRLGERPRRINYNKNNNRLTVGIWNGHVEIFEY